MKFKFLKPVFLGLVLLLPSLGNVANASLINLIENGDFETGGVGQAIPGWTRLNGGNTGANTNTQRVYSSPSLFPSAGQLLVIQGHNSGYSLEQSVAVTAGIEYNFSFDWGEGGDTWRNVYIKADIFNNDGTLLATSGQKTAGSNTNQLFNEAFSFTPTTNSIDIKFIENSRSRVFVWLDAVTLTTPSVTSVPEPSALAIFALCIMGLATRRFKK